MKKRFAIFVFFVLFLLIVSQLVWVNQVLERDKSRFKEEVKASINDIVKYQATLQTYNLFDIDSESPSITIETVNSNTVPDDIKIYGTYEPTKYQRESTISGFIESAMAEKLLEKESLNLQIIDSLFRDNFQYAPELLVYSLKTMKNNETTDSLYFGNNAIKQLNDTTKGVYITTPLGTSGAYRFVSHFIFKPTTITRRLVGLAVMSAIAVVAVAIILFSLLSQLQQQIYRLQSQEKRVRGIVHDLKSPLSYIFSMLGLFEIEEKDEEKIGLIADGKSRIKRLTDNIEKMLTDIKLNEKKKVVLQRQFYDIEKSCREIIKDLQVIYSNKNITIDFEIAEKAQTVYVDAFYFDNCLRNLLDNSIKYSHNNPVIKVAAQKEKNNTFISVTDNGKGISKRDQRHIFSSFFRSRNATSEAGHGIGLSAVQQIIKEHDGKIKLKSELGKGSEFIITLPDKK